MVQLKNTEVLMAHKVIFNNGVSIGESQHQYNTHVYTNKKTESEKKWINVSTQSEIKSKQE